MSETKKTIIIPCNACGNDFDCTHIETDDLCPACLRTNQVYRVIWYFGDKRVDKLAAGLPHVEQMMQEEVYWEYQEFNFQECEEMGHDKVGTRPDIVGMTFKQVGASVKAYQDCLQALWDEGVSKGIFSTNNVNQSGTWRVWPMKFRIEIEKVSKKEIETLLEPSPHARLAHLQRFINDSMSELLETGADHTPVLTLPGRHSTVVVALSEGPVVVSLYRGDFWTDTPELVEAYTFKGKPTDAKIAIKVQRFRDRNLKA